MVDKTIDERIRHITAIIIDQPFEEPFINVNYETFEYVKGTGDIHFKASVVYGTGGPSNEIDISFPFHFLRGGTDEEIIKWRDKRDNPKHDEQKSDEPRFPVERVLEIGRDFQNEDKWHGAHWDTVKLLCDTIERLQGKSQQVEVVFDKPLSTNGPLSKDQLIEYLQNADIPGDAECTLLFDNGKFYLYFYWGEDTGACGRAAVNFDIESKELVEDAWSYMEND